MKHKDRNHAIISPSSIYRAFECPESVILSMQMPEQEPSEYAQEGTLAHEVCEAMARTVLKGEPGVTVPDCDEEMWEYAENYVKFLSKLVRKFARDEIIDYWIEKKVTFSDWIWGTADFIAIRKNSNGRHEAIITDFKYGRGMEVQAENNLQSLTYLCCAEKELDLDLERAWIFIYQPRTPGKEYTKWKVGEEDIVSHMEDLEQIQNQICSMLEAEERGDTRCLEYNPGDLSHCRFCPGKVACPAFRKAASEDAMVLLDNEENLPEVVPTQPVVEIPMEKLVAIQQRKKSIEHFLKEVERFLMASIERGIEVPGYKLVSGQKRRTWPKGEEEKIAKELKKLGVEDPWRKQLITIGAAEKMVEGKNKDERKEALSPLVTFTEPKLQLAEVDDPRPGIDVNSDIMNMLDSLD